MKTTSGADTNIENWQYQINSDAWVEYNTIVDDSLVVLAYTDKISWRLKEGLSAGDESESSRTYNATMVVKCVENNGTIKFAEKDLLGEVHNQRITITSLTDNRNNTTTLKVDLFTASKFKYKLEKLTAENGIVEKNYWEYGNTISSSTLNINTLPMISNAVYGPGWYQVTAQAWNTSRKVSDVDAVEETYINWATATLSATNSVSDSYSENAGPSEGLPVTVSASWIAETSVEFNGAPNSTWEYQIGTAAWTSLSEINVNLPMSAVSGTQSSLSTFKVRMKAGFPKATYNEQITWFATGKDATNKTDTTTLNANITEGEELPKVAWIGFSGGNASGVKQYSDWYELETVETAKVVLDNEWPPAATGGQGGAIGVGIDIDFTPSNPFLGDTPTHNIFNNTPFTSDTLAPYGSTPSTSHPFHGKAIKSDDNGTTLYIMVEMDHTQFRIASSDASSYASSLSSFCTENSVTELPYIVITTNPTRPDNDVVSKPWITQAFDSDSFRMKCDGTWNYDDSDAEQYNLKIDGKNGSGANTTFRYSPSSPSGHASGPWNGIGMQFFCAAGLTPPTSGDSAGSIPMSNIKLELGTNNSGVYAKLSDGNPTGSICS